MKHTDLINAVRFIQGGSFVGIDTLVDVKLTGGRSNPQQGRVQKRMTGATVMAFTNQNVNAYHEMVKRRLEKEGKAAEDFVIGPRTWGVRIPNLPIVEHDGKYYFEVIFLRPGAVEYLLDGQPIAESSIQGLPVKKATPESQGGLEDKVIIRDFKCESIVELRIDGKAYR